MNNTKQTDILVIGSGFAGAIAAISATLEAQESRGTHYLLEDIE